ncbi:MAG: hypothetical protein DRG78_21330 [Epsilonproteobacteria bacterium]|nr:MAG: hypothetical protein DRG78_21330 [Campylobacterota bacterium]
MKKSTLIIVLLFSALSASEIQYKHQCARPIKPVSVTSNIEVEKYNNDMQNYQTCMMAFIEKHKVLRKKHTDALNEAIADWNSFASGSKKKDKSRKFTGSQGVPQGGSHTVGHSDPYKISTGLKF